LRRAATKVCDHGGIRGKRGIWGLPVVGKGAWLTTGEAAERLAVSDETIRRWVIAGATFRAGETMTTRGGHRRIASSAVDRLLREARDRATAESTEG
jgi:excisionase family DNA binding protein